MKLGGYRHVGRKRRKPAFYYTFRKMGQGVLCNGEVNLLREQPKRKRMPAALPGARCARLESLRRDPKPVDLCAARLKPSEREVEDRTCTDVQIVWMSCV